MRKIVSFVSALVIIAMQKYGKSFKLATNFLKSSTIICEKCFVTHNEAILLSNRLLNKRIVALFTVYRSGIAVSRIHDGVAGEGENLVAYAVNQLMVFAASRRAHRALPPSLRLSLSCRRAEACGRSLPWICFRAGRTCDIVLRHVLRGMSRRGMP